MAGLLRWSTEAVSWLPRLLGVVRALDAVSKVEESWTIAGSLEFLTDEELGEPRLTLPRSAINSFDGRVTLLLRHLSISVKTW